MPVRFTEYKGNKMIELIDDEEDKYPFSFGIRKAKKILANFDAIRKFVEENDKPSEKDQPA